MIQYVIITDVKGLTTYPKLTQSDLDELVLFARKNKEVNVTFLTPKNEVTRVALEVSKRPKGWVRILMDTWSSNFDISLVGQRNFEMNAERLPDPKERKEIFCGSRVMSIDVRPTGERFALSFMLDFLEDVANLEELDPIRPGEVQNA